MRWKEESAQLHQRDVETLILQVQTTTVSVHQPGSGATYAECLLAHMVHPDAM